MRSLVALTSGLLMLAALTTLSPSTLGAEKYDPYFVDKRTLKKEYKRIALAPIESPSSLAMPESAKQIIEAQITKRLKKRGYTVIPSTVLKDIRKTMIDQVGGLTDAKTGEVNAAKVDAVREHALRELWLTQDFDALAHARVEILEAPIENDKAEWDGTKQKVKKKGRLSYSAKIAASSVSFSIYDVREKPLYVNYGGLELLVERIEQEFHPLDTSEYFQDEKRILKAVDIALKPI